MNDRNVNKNYYDERNLENKNTGTLKKNTLSNNNINKSGSKQPPPASNQCRGENIAVIVVEGRTLSEIAQIIRS